MITTDFILYYFLIGLFVSLVVSRSLAYIDDPITSKYLWVYPASIIMWPVPVLTVLIFILVTIEERGYFKIINVIYEKIAEFLLKEI